MGIRPYLTGIGMEFMIIITIPYIHSSAVLALARLNINSVIYVLA